MCLAKRWSISIETGPARRTTGDAATTSSPRNPFPPISTRFQIGRSSKRPPHPKVAGRVLDIGCGTGKHVLEFQKRGLSATGIDISPLAINVCLERGVADARCMDIFRSHRFPDQFDAVTLFTNNLSLAGSPKRAMAFLRALRGLVRPDGVVVLTNLDVTHSKDEQDVAYRTRRTKVGRPTGQIVMRAEYAGFVGAWIRWLYIAPSELAAIAAPARWRIKDLGTMGAKYYAVLAMNGAPAASDSTENIGRFA